jgi:signal transduction histidine kinase/DNA-binding response OmpR family regulator
VRERSDPDEADVARELEPRTRSTLVRGYAQVALALGLLVILVVAARPVHFPSYQEVVARLRGLRSIELEWTAALESQRADLRSPPTALFPVLDELDLALAAVQATSMWNEVGKAPGIAGGVDAYCSTLMELRALAEEHQGHRNRLVADRHALVAVSAEATPLTRTPSPTASALVADVLAGLLAPRPRGDPFGAPARTLADSGPDERLAAVDDPVERERLEQLLASAASMRAHGEAADRLLDRMAALGLRSRSDEIVRACDEWFTRVQAVRERWGLVLCLYSLLLLVLVVREFRTRTMLLENLARARDSLEDRIRRRTTQLSKRNEQLANEIRERCDAEEQLVAARRAAEAASRTKSSFLANMSHEIRTPMTSILGFAERLGDEDLTHAERREAVESIQRGGQYLLQLINDILDLSKIEAGKLALERIPCSPAEVVLDVQSTMEVRAQSKGIEFFVEITSPIPERVVTDPVRLKQVLINLVGNAIKFTDEGTVILRVGFDPGRTADARSEVRPRLVLSVMDTGIGMSPEQVGELFRPYMQTDNSTSRKFGGTGLGLSICKSLVEQMGGTLSVQSLPGFGSTFEFTVETGVLDGATMLDAAGVKELRRGREAARLRESGVRLEGRILLAEDGEDNQRILVHHLTRAGAEVEVVGDGQAALERALGALAQGRPFDVVLMDMRMPRLDGYGATKRLRSAGYRLPIVALTANAMAQDRQRSLEAGCDDFCSKPIDKHGFLALLDRWIRRSRRGAGSQAGGSGAPMDDTKFRTLANVASSAAGAAPKGAARGGPEPLLPRAQKDAELEELVRFFVLDLENDVARLTEALEAGDLERLGHLAHQIKGSAGSYGFPDLTRLAARLERCARGALPDAHVEIELEELARACRRLRADVEGAPPAA